MTHYITIVPPLMRKHLLTLSALFALSAAAQNDVGSSSSEGALWLGADASYDITSDLEAGLEVGGRLEDDFSTFTRYDAALGLSYKPLKWLKLGGGYDFIRDYSAGEVEERFRQSTTVPGKLVFNGFNVTDDYWRTKHRLYFDLTEKWKVGRFGFSLRERYQYTHYAEVDGVVRKYRDEYDENEYERLVQQGASPADFMPRVDDEGDCYWYALDRIDGKNAKDKHYLRTRLAVDYNIRRCPVTPFVSYELANDLGDAFGIVRHRAMAGFDCNLTKSKQHVLTVAYLYQHGAKEESGNADLHVVSIGYKFSFESAKAAAQKSAKKKAKKGKK